MFCSKCGVGLAEGERFCSKCGHQVGGSISEAERSSGWLKSSRKRTWFAIIALWACCFLVFSILYVPLKENISFNPYISYFGRKVNNEYGGHTEYLRGPIFKLASHQSPETSYSTEADSVDYHVVWDKWLKELLVMTLPAIILFGLTFIRPVRADEVS